MSLASSLLSTIAYENKLCACYPGRVNGESDCGILTSPYHRWTIIIASENAFTSTRLIATVAETPRSLARSSFWNWNASATYLIYMKQKISACKQLKHIRHLPRIATITKGITLRGNLLGMLNSCFHNHLWSQIVGQHCLKQFGP